MKFTSLVAVAFTAILLSIQSASAQSSVSIGEGFECFTDIDGSISLARLNNDGLKTVKIAAVNARVNKELRKLDGKSDKLKEITHAKLGIVDRLLVKFIQSFVRSFPDSGFEPNYDDIEERIAVVKGIKDYINQQRADLHAVVKRAKACKGGTTSPPKNGSIINPTLKLVSFRGGQNAYAGFLVLTKPRIPKFSKKPGGFNVCTRIEDTDLSTGGKTVSGVYTGVGTQLCFFGGVIVDDNAVTACNATMPAGFVGLFLKKAEGSDLSDEGLHNLESLIVGNPPTVSLLALDQFTGSRDAAVARCEKFKQ